MRACVVVALGVVVSTLLSACATDRATLQPGPATLADAGTGTGTGANRYAPPARSTRPAGPMTAQALASRMGLRYEDERNHVLLSDQMTRVRIWKDSNEVSVSGRSAHLPARTKRHGRNLIVPGSTVSYVETKVYEERKLLEPPPAVSVRPTWRPPLPIPEPKPPKVIEDLGRAKDDAGEAPAADPEPTLPSADAAWAVHAQPTRAWRWIVIHHSDDTSGNLAKYDRIHREQEGWDECGYHFVIGNGSLSGDGEVEIGSRWFKQKHGAHAKTPDNRYNDFGIGICLVGDFETRGRPTRAQMDSLVRLCHWLMVRHDIPLGRILGHCECKATACPGRHFPWGELRARLAAPR